MKSSPLGLAWRMSSVALIAFLAVPVGGNRGTPTILIPGNWSITLWKPLRRAVEKNPPAIPSMMAPEPLIPAFWSRERFLYSVSQKARSRYWSGDDVHFRPCAAQDSRATEVVQHSVCAHLPADRIVEPDVAGHIDPRDRLQQVHDDHRDSLWRWLGKGRLDDLDLDGRYGDDIDSPLNEVLDDRHLVGKRRYGWLGIA